MVKLIAIDLDGTLLRNDQQYDQVRFRNIVKKLYNKGIIVAIATGNSFLQSLYYIDDETIPNLYFVTDNGNTIGKAYDLFHVNSLDREIARKVINDISKSKDFYTQVNTDKGLYLFKSEDSIFEELAKVFNNLVEIDSFEDIPKDEEIILVALATVKRRKDVYDVSVKLQEKYPQLHISQSGPDWIDVFSKDGGKHIGLKYLQDKYNIDIKDTMTFGDSNNDLSMMKLAKYSIAMQESSDGLLEVAKYQIGSNNDSAVIKLLEEIDENSDMDFMEKYKI
ncbi:MAG: HAD family hydrolase [Helcococcus sp.]|nr:HAD family hydrolase [Helcococcus sp.]